MKEIIKNLEQITRHHKVTVFSDWIALMFYAFQRNDEEYLKIAKKYNDGAEKGKREIDYMCYAMGELIMEMQKTNKETLSGLYMEIGGNEGLGQFFTPSHVSRFIAQLVQGGGSIADQACGAGGMLIEKAQTMTNKEIDKSFFVGQDLDWLCVQMCALNLMFFNLNGMVIHGNTISGEMFSAFRTTRSYLYGGSLQETEIPKEELGQMVMF
jgi:type I restriction-modification system DNA methylase subunit